MSGPRSDEQARCVLRHPDPRRAVLGARICLGHLHGLAETLEDIRTLFALLDDVIEPGSVADAESVRFARTIDPPAPLRLDVVALRDNRTAGSREAREPVSPHRALFRHAANLRLERQLEGVRFGRTTVADDVAVLLAHLEHAAAAPWVVELNADARYVRAELRAVVGERDPEPVGRCPIVVDDDGECGGRLYADRYGAMRVTCTRCHALWDETELRRLGLLITS